MAKTNNLTDFLTSEANKFRSVLGTSGTINPQDFDDLIDDVYTKGYNDAPSGTDVSNTTATQADVLTSKYFYNSSGTRVQGSMANNGSLGTTTLTASTTSKTIPAGYTSGGTVNINTTNLSAGNIKKGVSMMGLTGTYTSDATATASNIDYGKTAYVNGSKITGSFYPLNLSILRIDTGSSTALRTITFTAYGEVNSIVLTTWGYMSSTTLNTRRVTKIVHIPNMYSKSDRYKFLTAVGGARPSSGYSQAEGYITGFNGVSYNYNSSTNETTITITLPDTNMSGYAGTARFSSVYHIFAFYVASDLSNVNINSSSGTTVQSIGNVSQLMSMEESENLNDESFDFGYENDVTQEKDELMESE